MQVKTNIIKQTNIDNLCILIELILIGACLRFWQSEVHITFLWNLLFGHDRNISLLSIFVTFFIKKKTMT
jgi:hypothetical protein